jgi:hypothetical protein
VPVSRRRRKGIERELRSHLEESRAELERAGRSPEEAVSESIARLGNPEEIGQAFNEAYSAGRRPRVGLAVGLASALLLGVYGGGALAAHQPQPAHAKVAKSTQSHPGAQRHTNVSR